MRTFVFLISIISALSASAQRSDYEIKISGFVLDFFSNVPLDSCNVTMVSSSGYVRTTFAGTNGSFSFDSVDTYYVIYKLWAERHHYKDTLQVQTKILMTKDTVVELKMKPKIIQEEESPEAEHQENMNPTELYMVLSLCIKAKSVCYGCRIKRKNLDDVACLQIISDTMSGQKLMKRRTYSDICYLPLDSLTQPFNFQVEEFWAGCNFPGDDIWKRQDSNCFTTQFIGCMRKYSSKDCSYSLINIKIKDTLSNRKLRIDGFPIKVFR